jgi:hypothetical protein
MCNSQGDATYPFARIMMMLTYTLSSISTRAYPQHHTVFDVHGEQYPPPPRPHPSGPQLAASHQPHSERPVPRNHKIIEID